jgi:hypothetical protein
VINSRIAAGIYKNICDEGADIQAGIWRFGIALFAVDKLEPVGRHGFNLDEKTAALVACAKTINPRELQTFAISLPSPRPVVRRRRQSHQQ